MLCSKCGKEIPKGQEVHKEGEVRGGTTWSRGGVMCKECAFPPFYKKWWFWVIIFVVVVILVGSISSAFSSSKPN